MTRAAATTPNPSMAVGVGVGIGEDGAACVAAAGGKVGETGLGVGVDGIVVGARVGARVEVGIPVGVETGGEGWADVEVGSVGEEDAGVARLSWPVSVTPTIVGYVPWIQSLSDWACSFFGSSLKAELISSTQRRSVASPGPGWISEVGYLYCKIVRHNNPA